MTLRAGFIGLGAMGEPMAANLAAGGSLAAVWNRSAAKAQRFAADHGCAVAADPAALWQDADAVILCVSADAQVLEVVDALACAAGAGKLVIDTSTVAAQTAQEAARRLAVHGIRFLDAPVTGGTEGARQGRLSFMIGGAAADLEQAAPLLAAMGARQVHMGPIGAGQATKAVNQVMCAGINQAVTEGLAFATALGLPLEKVIEVVGSGAAGSWFVNHRGPSMVRGEFPLGFKLSLHLKDLYICQAMATARGGHLPVTEATIAQYEALRDQGHGDEDISALYRLNRKLFPDAA